MKGPTYKCILIKGTGTYINNNTHTKKYYCIKDKKIFMFQTLRPYFFRGTQKGDISLLAKKTKSQTFYLTFPFVFHRRKKVI